MARYLLLADIDKREATFIGSPERRFRVQTMSWRAGTEALSRSFGADHESLGIPSFSINSYNVGRLMPSSRAAEVIFPL